MAFENLIIEKKGNVAILTINRPKALNALNTLTLKEMQKAIFMLGDDPDVAVIILTGAGEKAFVAGADISEMKDFDVNQAISFSMEGHRTMDAFSHIEKVVIAAVNGYALGGGCEIALACDFIYASQNARFGLPEVTLGIFPGFGGTQRLPRLIGKGKAKELIFTGEMITAQQALELGIVNKIFPSENLMEESLKTASKIASNGQVGIRMAKRVIDAGFDVSLSEGSFFESKAWGLVFGTYDQKEGMNAFLEKRKPVYKGK
ncbi:MAG: enoyl-CoA hydratase/isomerase family protein [Deltaproteobacteria bacterium]|nr:enoyl-CoA hydratase/isomerase family protein [Deltaproteobacteria bacterium]